MEMLQIITTILQQSREVHGGNPTAMYINVAAVLPDIWIRFINNTNAGQEILSNG